MADAPHDHVPADDDTSWASISDETAHPVLGRFADAAVEVRFVAHAHATVGTLAIIQTATIIFIPFSLAVGALRFTPLAESWAVSLTVTVVNPCLAVLLAAIAANHKLSADAVRRAARHDVLATASSAVMLIGGFITTFEANAAFGRSYRADNPSASDAEVHQMSTNGFKVSVVPLFLVAIACNVRKMALYPVLLLVYAVTFASLAFVTSGPIDTQRQIVVRAVTYVMFFGSAAYAVHVIEASSRAAFLLTKQVASLATETRATAAQINNLLGAMLTASVLRRVASGEHRIFDAAPTASVSFSDVAGFTNWSSSRSSEDVVEMVSALTSAYDGAARAAQVTKIKTIGDAFWAVSGLPEKTTECGKRICDFALRQQELLVGLNADHPQWGGIELRVGCHTGLLVGGVVGSTQMSYEVFGDTNEFAEQHEQQAPRGGVLVSQATVDLATSCGLFNFAENSVIINDTKTFVVTRSVETMPAAPRSPQTTLLQSAHPENILDVAMSVRADRRNVLRFLGVSVRSRRNSLPVMSPPCEAEPPSGSDALVEFIQVGNVPGCDAVSTRDQPSAMTLGTGNVVDASGWYDDADEEDDEGGPSDDTATTGSCCAVKFVDPAVEQTFFDYDNDGKRAARTASAANMGVVGIAFLVAVLLEAPSNAYRDVAAPLTIFPVCAVLLAALAGGNRRIDLTRGQAMAFHIVQFALMCCYIVAVGLLPPMLVADTYTVHALCVCNLYISPPSHMPLLGHLGLRTAGVLLAAVLSPYPYTLAGHVIWCVTSIAISMAWLGIAQGARDRTKFIAHRHAEAAAAAAHAEEAVERSLLAVMAPAHVLDDMVTVAASKEFRAGAPASIAQTLHGVTVCFIKMTTKAEHADAEAAYDDIAVAHAGVEQHLQLFPLVTKIKTVGATLVVAGPLHDGATDAERSAAAREVFAFACDVVLESTRGESKLAGSLLGEPGAARRLASRAGLCTGPLVAAVMGTDRLAYVLGFMPLPLGRTNNRIINVGVLRKLHPPKPGDSPKMSLSPPSTRLHLLHAASTVTTAWHRLT
jgi:class 3 adenylate cyclase